MSGSSAIASARRRRAAAQPDNVNISIQEQREQKPLPIINEENRNKIPPLQLLQIHDSKINDLEMNLEGKITTIISGVLDKLLTENNIKLKNEVVTYTENKLAQSFSNVKINLNYDEIISKVNTSLSEDYSSKFADINNSLTSLTSNIENSPSINLDENLLIKIDNINNEMNALKLVVIKNQTLSLESNVETNKLREILNSLKDKIENIENSIDNNQNNDTEMLLRNMFQGQLGASNFSKINIHDDEEDSEVSNDRLDINSLDETLLCKNIEITDDMVEEIKNELTDDNLKTEVTEDQQIVELVE
jgi:hypothetical protein